MASEIKRALLGRLAINAGLITQDQVLDCLNEQQKIVHEKGTVPHLGDILLQKGYLAKDQVQAMLKLKGSPEALPEDRDFSLFGDYEILEKIDSDASGTVYMVRNQKSGDVVDLKILSRVTTRPSDFQERFVNQSKRGIGLKHPNIKQMLTAGCLEGRYYYISEHVEGSSLSRILGDNKKLSVEDATRIMLGAAAALRHAHQNGVVHGDVRPSHIFVAVDGTIKLAEFGVLKDVLRDVMRLMGTAETVGYYIAPEQVVGDRKIDGRADLYSLGAVYYHLLLGKPPYDGSTPFQCLVRFCIDHITHPNAENQSIPKITSDIVMKMLEPEPDERYQSITQVEDALENIYNSGGTVIAAKAAMQEVSKPKVPAKKKKKRKTETSMMVDGGAKKPPVPGMKAEGKKPAGRSLRRPGRGEGNTV